MFLRLICWTLTFLCPLNIKPRNGLSVVTAPILPRHPRPLLMSSLLMPLNLKSPPRFPKTSTTTLTSFPLSSRVSPQTVYSPFRLVVLPRSLTPSRMSVLTPTASSSLELWRVYPRLRPCLSTKTPIAGSTNLVPL